MHAPHHGWCHNLMINSESIIWGWPSKQHSDFLLWSYVVTSCSVTFSPVLCGCVCLYHVCLYVTCMHKEYVFPMCGRIWVYLLFVCLMCCLYMWCVSCVFADHNHLCPSSAFPWTLMWETVSLTKIPRSGFPSGLTSFLVYHENSKVCT